MALDLKDVLPYMLAGKAILLVTSERTGTTYRFKIKKKRNVNVWHVYNDRLQTEYNYIATIFKNTSDLWAFRGADFGGNTNLQQEEEDRIKQGLSSLIEKLRTSQEVFQWCFHKLTDEPDSPVLKKIIFRHDDTCGRCGRPLTDPASIQRGLGPECYKKSSI